MQDYGAKWGTCGRVTQFAREGIRKFLWTGELYCTPFEELKSAISYNGWAKTTGVELGDLVRSGYMEKAAKSRHYDLAEMFEVFVPKK